MLSLAAVQWQQCFEGGERNEMGEHSRGRKEIKAEAHSNSNEKENILQDPCSLCPFSYLVVLSSV